MLKIHNSLTGVKEEFVPLEPRRVRMYVCGITVYDHIHLGHARMLLVFDLVQRYLRELGFEVTYVRNITDIDDKIIERAAANGEDWSELARRFTQAMHATSVTFGNETSVASKPDWLPCSTSCTRSGNGRPSEAIWSMYASRVLPVKRGFESFS